MRGSVLGFDYSRNEGVISGADGSRYAFTMEDWRGDHVNMAPGTGVDFDPRDGTAVAIYPIAVPAQFPSVAQSGKTPVAAGLLAFFFGGFGIHKFYMGYSTQGVMLLVGTIMSWLLVLVFVGILGLMAIGIVVFIESIILFTRSQQDFDTIYLTGKRPWF